MRIDDDSLYREGLVVDRPVKKGQGSYVNAGLRKEVQVDRHLKAGIRVTVRMTSTGIGHIQQCLFVSLGSFICCTHLRFHSRQSRQS